jgi:hypothetical protein
VAGPSTTRRSNQMNIFTVIGIIVVVVFVAGYFGFR